MTIDNAHEPEFDVAIVGYGPVGQALAAMLGRAGHRVAVFERFDEIYRHAPGGASRSRDHAAAAVARAVRRAGRGDGSGPRLPLVRRRRRAAAALRRAAARRDPGGSRTTCSSSPSWSSDPRHACIPSGWRSSEAGRRGAVQDRRPGRADASPGHRRRRRPAGADRGVPDRSRPLAGRGRRRELVRARGERYQPPGPRLPGAVAGRGRRAA